MPIPEPCDILVDRGCVQGRCGGKTIHLLDLWEKFGTCGLLLYHGCVLVDPEPTRGLSIAVLNARFVVTRAVNFLHWFPVLQADLGNWVSWGLEAGWDSGSFEPPVMILLRSAMSLFHL